MNRYVADGILLDVCAHGRVVLAVMEDMRSVREALEKLIERVSAMGLDEYVTIRRANGQEEISAVSGGRVVFVSVRGTGGRGMRADVLYLAGELTRERVAELMPTLVASTRGEVIYR